MSIAFETGAATSLASGHKGSQKGTLRERIDASYAKAVAHQERLKRSERRFGTTQTALTGLSSLIAGVTTAAGHPLVGDWRLVCAGAAVSAFSATIVSATQKGRSDPETYARVSECVGKLRSLRVEALDPKGQEQVLRDKYRVVLLEYDGVDC